VFGGVKNLEKVNRENLRYNIGINCGVKKFEKVNRDKYDP
jgi:hypothetical protein